MSMLPRELYLQVVMQFRTAILLYLSIKNTFNLSNLKAWPNARNSSTQHLATLLGTTCCVRLATLLRCVATCWMMLDQIWKRSNFSCNILDVAWCCTRLATFTQHCCARACALGPLAIATRQRNDGFLSVTMADNTAQIQQPKKKCPRKWTEGETTSLIDLLEERPCLWNIVEKSYHSRETIEQGFEELKCLLFHHPQEVTPMKKLRFDDADIDTTQSPPYWFLVYIRVPEAWGS